MVEKWNRPYIVNDISKCSENMVIIRNMPNARNNVDNKLLEQKILDPYHAK